MAGVDAPDLVFGEGRFGIGVPFLGAIFTVQIEDDDVRIGHGAQRRLNQAGYRPGLTGARLAEDGCMPSKKCRGINEHIDAVKRAEFAHLVIGFTELGKQHFQRGSIDQVQFCSGGRKMGHPSNETAFGSDLAEGVHFHHAGQNPFRVDFLPHTFHDNQHVQPRLPDHQVRTDLSNPDQDVIYRNFRCEAFFIRDHLGDKFASVDLNDMSNKCVFFTDHDVSLPDRISVNSCAGGQSCDGFAPNLGNILTFYGQLLN